jgi:hypothetical protein
MVYCRSDVQKVGLNSKAEFLQDSSGVAQQRVNFGRNRN